VVVSPVAYDRYEPLLNKLRGGRSPPPQGSDDLPGEVRTFVTGSDMLTILGWNVAEEPALLISADKLLAKLPSLKPIYPEGFVLISDVRSKALLVDFDDEQGTHVNIVDLLTHTL
jgi:hypothetical protein